MQEPDRCEPARFFAFDGARHASRDLGVSAPVTGCAPSLYDDGGRFATKKQRT
jgi:hypothetical protein